jgi:endoglucanase
MIGRKTCSRVFVALIVLAAHSAPCAAAPIYTGVNLAGAEFTPNALPGVYNSHYTYPTLAEINYFTVKGANTFRLPFLWERLQRTLNGNFDASELARIQQFVANATARGAYVVLDPHNYARYQGSVIGSNAVPNAAFSDLWSRLATTFKSNNRVIFGLVNEPNNMPSTEQWVNSANAAIAGIRATGATNLILVPGNGWSGGHSWSENWYGTPNAVALLNVVDPFNNYAYEIHQYLDPSTGGSAEEPARATIGVERLSGVTQWLQRNNRRGFLGEFGVPRTELSYRALDNMLDFIDLNDDAWIGWTYWAAGPWWGEYHFTVEPTSAGQDRPQMAVLDQHFVPEPTSIAVLSVGALSLGLIQWVRNRQSNSAQPIALPSSASGPPEGSPRPFRLLPCPTVREQKQASPDDSLGQSPRKWYRVAMFSHR